MDYMSGMMSTKQGNDCVFLGVDRFFKMAIITAYKKNIIVEDTANILFERVSIHFGIPQTIIYEQDNKFLNTFHPRQPLFGCLVPQTDNQTEVVNWMIVHILRMYNSKHPHTWDESLPYFQHSYNRAMHKSTIHSPFQVGMGLQPLEPIDVSLTFTTTQT
jgi:hypothetical protein